MPNRWEFRVQRVNGKSQFLNPLMNTGITKKKIIINA